MSRPIHVSTLQNWLAEGEAVTIVDVRPEEDFEEWRIPGSVRTDPRSVLELDLPSDRPIVTVCAAGNTSQDVADSLQDRGYDARSLAGGMKAWGLAWNTAAAELPNGVWLTQVRRTGKGCLSYLAASGGEALVIDPALPPDVFLRIARDQGVEIVGVLDTHVHADHVSRSSQLARSAGVPYYLPEQTRVACTGNTLGDGDQLRFGTTELTCIHTPGHTWESACFQLEGAVFTGDTLFLDSVGRPDLEADGDEAERRADALYSSLQQLIKVPDETLVLPAHADEPPGFDDRLWGARLAEVKERAKPVRLDRGAFIEYVTGNAPPAPANHLRIVELNEACEHPADVSELEAGANRCAVA